MKHAVFVSGAVLVVAAGLCGTARAGSVTYVLDPSHTQVTWEVVHLRTSTMRGRFNRIEGHVTLDRAARQGELSISVDTASVSSGVAPLDGLLRGSQMLSSEEHPKAFFIARQISFEAGQPASVRGEFTLRGISQPLQLRATGFNCYQHPSLRREVCGGDFEGELKRSSFGINHSLPFVADRVRLLVQVEGVRQ